MRLKFLLLFCLAPFVEKLFSSITVLTFVKNQLGIFVWVHFWILYSVSFIYVYTFANTKQTWLLYQISLE